MGLLLSVLVACVGVIELISFYANVKRNLTLRPVSRDLSVVRAGYIQELYGVRKRIQSDLENVQREVSTIPLTKNRSIPAFRLNSHEDIEIEYNQGVAVRSRSCSPRRFLVTEKERSDKCTTPLVPRHFVVAEEPKGIEKSKCQFSLPEFFIQERNNYEKSPDRPRYVLKEHEGRSGSPIPLPTQFIVTETDSTISKAHDASHESIYRRSPSPYPPLDLPQPTRNSVCNELMDNPSISVFEVDEESYKSRSPSPRYADHDLNSNFDSTSYWKNKVLIVPHKKSKSRSPSPGADKKQRSVSPNASRETDEKMRFQRTRSKSEYDSTAAVTHQTVVVDNYQTDVAEPECDHLAPFEGGVLLPEHSTIDEHFLNSLDGVNRQRIVKRSCSSRKSIKRKTIVTRDLETAPSTKLENAFKQEIGNSSESCSYEDATNVYEAANDTADSTESKTPEPFWLIFSGEYTKAMNKDWHGQHFCCWQCDESLTGQRYVLRDDHPYCVSCYESVFANACEKCSRTIGIDSKDLSYKDKHWHEACFLCTTCGESLVDKQFGSKGDRIYCGSCYDQQFASRCDGCHEIFRAGTKKMEYKTRQWHEKCFCCCVCKVPIGTQSFIPREQEIYCAKCYEEKFATRCIKCNKVITSGGVTYKNEPWHRECFTCTHCQKSLAGERFTSRDEKPFCAECFGELFAKRCTACNKPITGIGGTKFISFEDRHWHNDCFFCASCRTSLVGRGFITDQEDIICPECAKQKLM